MKSLLRVGGVLLILGTLVYIGRSWSASAIQPAAPASRIALVNLTHVIKNYDKYKAFQEEIKKEVDQYIKREKELREQIEELNRELKASDITADKTEEIEKKIKKLEHELSDMAEEAKKVLGKKSDKEMVALYGDVRQAAEQYAKAHDIELVLHYNDASPDDKEFFSANNVARKIQAGACMPLYAVPGMDISKEIVAALNEK
jgi:Skp family chaperone for outer membrane proteins